MEFTSYCCWNIVGWCWTTWNNLIKHTGRIVSKIFTQIWSTHFLSTKRLICVFVPFSLFLSVLRQFLIVFWFKYTMKKLMIWCIHTANGWWSFIYFVVIFFLPSNCTIRRTYMWVHVCMWNICMAHWQSPSVSCHLSNEWNLEWRIFSFGYDWEKTEFRFRICYCWWEMILLN